MAVLWLADVLRDAAVPVVEMFGWRNRSNGTLKADSVVWHHDGSGVGASPSIPAYIARQVDARKPGANVWVALDGTWFLIASGLTFHAGKTLPGKPGNSRAIGIETDHTTGETWSGVDLLRSLRVGTAAILRHMGQDESRLEFHKTICKPVGRKQDPDGLSLDIERRAIAALMEDDDVTDGDIEKIAKRVAELLMNPDHLGPVKHHIVGAAAEGARLARAVKILESKA